MRILIDCDICIDFLTGRTPYFNNAKKVFWEIENSELQAVVSPESFSNIFYVLRRTYSTHLIVSYLKDLESLVQISAMNGQVIKLALDSGWKDFEDAIQYYCAIQSECDSIITRNAKDYEKSELPVFSPYKFLNRE